MNYDKLLDQYCKSSKDPLGKINLLAIFLGLQTIIEIAAVSDRTGRKPPKNSLRENKCL